MVPSTVSRSSVELTAWLTSPSARSSSTERASSRVRARTSSNSRTFSIAITAWSAKVVDQLDLLVGERPHGGSRSDANHANRGSFPQQGDAEHGAKVADFLQLEPDVFGIGKAIREVNRRACRAVRPTSAAASRWNWVAL